MVNALPQAQLASGMFRSVSITSTSGAVSATIPPRFKRAMRLWRDGGDGMAIGLRSAYWAARPLVRFARVAPKLLSLLVISMLGLVAADGIAPQDDAERRTEVAYRHFV